MFKKISSILSSKFGKKDYLSKQIKIVQVFDMYRDGTKGLIPGAPEPNPISLKNKTLTVSVQSSSHASELRMQESEIVETINQHFGEEVIKRVAYRF